MQKILEKANEQYKLQLPFVLYAKPDANELSAFFQKDTVLEKFKEQTGFVFAPFLGSDKYIISSKNSFFISKPIVPLEMNFSETVDDLPDEEEQNKFELLVKKGIEAIHEKAFDKVVLSRKVTIDLSLNFIKSFQNLVAKYQSAFRYLFYHPEIGMWMGATPEQLVKESDNTITTVALAGTQLYEENLIWYPKEIQEQQFVTDFIVKELKQFTDEITVSKPFTVKAGSLAHIKTTVSASLKENTLLTNILDKLHPTPAVCGLPKKESLEFIVKNEGYNRKFYAGFLGEWQVNGKTDLFVNLRCMEIEEKKINLYVGCGITKESIPKNEYIETKNKLGTLLKILKSK